MPVAAISSGALRELLSRDLLGWRSTASMRSEQ
jgi:hypothetical protein